MNGGTRLHLRVQGGEAHELFVTPPQLRDTHTHMKRQQKYEKLKRENEQQPNKTTTTATSKPKKWPFETPNNFSQTRLRVEQQ